MAQNCIHLIHSYFNFHCIPIYSYKNTVKNPLAAQTLKSDYQEVNLLGSHFFYVNIVD